MKPYYDDGKGIQIYNGDCRDILPHVTGDCFLTDPFYGVNESGGNANRGKAMYAGNHFQDTPEEVQTIVIPVIKLLDSRGIPGAVTPGNRCLTLYPPLVMLDVSSNHLRSVSGHGDLSP